MRSSKEYPLIACCHLFNMAPAWGLIFCGWVWYGMREESRLVVAQARQAMAFHALLLLALLAWMAMWLLAQLFSVLSPTFGHWFMNVNNAIMLISYLLYAGVCLAGFARAMSGRLFRYPLVRIRR
jgi:uncharacterized Tic20 family protein